MRAIDDYRFIGRLKALPFIEAIYLYGSRARGDHRSRSDIDLAIVCPQADRSQWQQILNIIEEADTLLAIDAIRLDELPEGALKTNIEADKKAIYWREPLNESSGIAKGD